MKTISQYVDYIEVFATKVIILQLCELDYDYQYNRAKVRKAEIKTIFNNLQERTNMKIIDYLEELYN
jgi:hypothetical protein